MYILVQSKYGLVTNIFETYGFQMDLEFECSEFEPDCTQILGFRYW